MTQRTAKLLIDDGGMHVTGPVPEVEELHRLFSSSGIHCSVGRDADGPNAYIDFGKTLDGYKVFRLFMGWRDGEK